MSKQTKKAVKIPTYTFPKKMSDVYNRITQLEHEIELVKAAKENNQLLKELGKLDTTTVVNIALACPEYAKQQEMIKQLTPKKKELAALRVHAREQQKKEQERIQEGYRIQNFKNVDRFVGKLYGRTDITFEEIWNIVKNDYCYYGTKTELNDYKEWKEKKLKKKT